MTTECINERKEKVESVFLRTVLRKDVYERLKAVAVQYATGRGDWDFGVAILVLLDQHDDMKRYVNDQKLDMILSLVSAQDVQKDTVEDSEKQEEMIELLGGTKIPRKG